MNTSVRARLDARGFSFVELLVTIIIAGIAFAAMFPLFVGAQQQQASDGFRTIGVNLAQDMIERVRQLDYDQIETSNLRDPDFANHQFGLTQNVSSAGSSVRTFHTVGTVSLKPDGSTVGKEAYKLVTVEVWWDGPPSPVKRTVLQTYVYRQYAGPQIVNLTPPPSMLGEDLYTPLSSIKLTATIANNDVSSMVYNSAKGWVTFAVAALNGSYSLSTGNTVKTSDSGMPSMYSWTWDASGAPDGKYVLSAKAVSALQRPGNVYERTVIVDKQAPPPVTNFVITPQNGSLSLSWDPSTEGDISHYQIWRGGASGAETLLVDNYVGTAYLDIGLTNGTTYYYYIKAVDIYGPKVWLPCAEKSEAPAVPAVDGNPPTAPSGLDATTVPQSGQINLVWTASQDNPPPATPSGVARYVVERSASSTGPWTQLTTNCVTANFTDTTVGHNSPLYYYRVMAFDVAGNPSGYSNVDSAQTDGPPTGSLKLNNKVGGKIYVKVKYNTTPPVYYNTSGAVVASTFNTSINNNNDRTWSNLPAGSYTVLWDSSSGGSYGSQKTVMVSAGSTQSYDLP